VPAESGFSLVQAGGEGQVLLFYGMTLRLTLICVGLFASHLAAQTDDHAKHDTGHSGGAVFGRVTFPNSGKATAQKPFLTGLALLHSFEYEQAADSFRSAQKIDPKFALAYWMEAFTNSKVVWGLEDTVTALKALRRLAPGSEARLALARTDRERAFGRAIEEFYKPGTLETRINRFDNAMRAWASSMPSDHEAHAFAALGLIWQAFLRRGEQADSLNKKATEHAQFVFDRNPQHPGAAHYIIHASDAPAAAHRGLKAAREYSRIAPDAGHALHMPSHIFLPLGLWDDMVQSNERSWRAARAEVARLNLSPWDNDWHSLNWLQYAYLQQGRWKDARALIDTARALTSSMRGKVSAADNPDAAFAVEQLAFRYGAETGDWSQFHADSAEISLADSSISPRARGMASGSVYQRGTVAALRGDSIAAMRAANALRQSRPAFAALIEITLLKAQNRSDDAIARLEKLRPMSRVDRYTSMVPRSEVNIDEALGDALLAQHRAAEAVKVFQEALADRPNRAAGLAGLARAQAAAGDTTGSAKTLALLARNLRRADPEARKFLGAN
jgi:tetratricopeptide (TPR) repeat protein